MSDSEHELLSAAYDREASPAEKARVEERLRDSPEARREWSELEQLTGLLRELPKESLPPEFPSRVLKLAEQRSLLPAAGARSFTPRWVAPVVTAAAAMLLIAGVWWINSPAEEPLVARTDSPEPQLAVSVDTGLASESQLAPMEGAAPPVDLPARAVSREMSEEASIPLADSMNVPGAPLPDFGGVQVYSVWVVDSADGLQLVQQAFERNQVTVTAGPSRKRDLARNAEMTEEALCVVATSQQIEKTLEDLRKSRTVNSVVDEDQIEIAALPPDIRRFFTEAVPFDSVAAAKLPSSRSRVKEPVTAPKAVASPEKDRAGQPNASESRQLAVDIAPVLLEPAGSRKSAAGLTPRADPATMRIILLVRRGPQPVPADSRPPNGA